MDRDLETIPIQHKIEKEQIQRRFSKQLAPELRNETVQRLKEIRKLPKTYNQLQKMVDQLDDPFLRKLINEMKGNIIGRLFKTHDYKLLERQLEKRAVTYQKHKIGKTQEDFKERFEKILKKSLPLTGKEQEEFLSEEAMINMDLKTYLFLMKRLSGNFVAHVTRYGIREQSHMYHRAGLGAFHTSFINILKSKKLYSFFSNFVENPNRYPTIYELIRDYMKDSFRGDKLINEVLATLTINPSTPADRASVHFAVNNILKDYGAEKGYNFYFYFPAEFIAYNYYHSGRESGDLAHSGTAGWDNDMAIWNQGKGIPIDAGIVCIPGDVMVDEDSGSQYQIEDGKPVLDNHGNYIVAKNTISSKEYWENYSQKHPEQRPSKIMYYRRDLPFETYGLGPKYEELFKKKQFKEREEEKLPGYNKYVDEIVEEFRQRIKEIEHQISKETQYNMGNKK